MHLEDHILNQDGMNYGCHYRGAESLMIEPCHADRISDVLAVVHLCVARKSKPARPVDFSTYAAMAERFIKEVHELWRVEDEEEKGHHHDRLG